MHTVLMPCSDRGCFQIHVLYRSPAELMTSLMPLSLPDTQLLLHVEHSFKKVSSLSRFYCLLVPSISLSVLIVTTNWASHLSVHRQWELQCVMCRNQWDQHLGDVTLSEGPASRRRMAVSKTSSCRSRPAFGSLTSLCHEQDNIRPVLAHVSGVSRSCWRECIEGVLPVTSTSSSWGSTPWLSVGGLRYCESISRKPDMLSARLVASQEVSLAREGQRATWWSNCAHSSPHFLDSRPHFAPRACLTPSCIEMRETSLTKSCSLCVGSPCQRTYV